MTQSEEQDWKETAEIGAKLMALTQDQISELKNLRDRCVQTRSDLLTADFADKTANYDFESLLYNLKEKVAEKP